MTLVYTCQILRATCQEMGALIETPLPNPLRLGNTGGLREKDSRLLITVSVLLCVICVV